MERYDREMSKRNELEVNVLMNQILKNLINIGSNSIEIMKKVILANPEIIAEDERKTAIKETAERKKYVDDNAGDVSESYRLQVMEEATRRINKRRIARTIPEIQTYAIMAHNLFVRFGHAQDGYTWSDFYKHENEESDKERFLRESMNLELRNELRHKTVCNVIKYSYKYWENIKEKDMDFLAHHFSTLFPNTDFTDKLEIIYGNNDERKNYVSEEDLDIVWRFIHGTIKLCIKYMYYTGRESFQIRKNDVVVDTIVIDKDYDIQNWEVKLQVRTDNLESWAEVN